MVETNCEACEPNDFEMTLNKESARLNAKKLLATRSGCSSSLSALRVAKYRPMRIVGRYGTCPVPT
jgi:hypothetical protein